MTSRLLSDSSHSVTSLVTLKMCEKRKKYVSVPHIQHINNLDHKMHNKLYLKDVTGSLKRASVKNLLNYANIANSVPNPCTEIPPKKQFIVSQTVMVKI